jgi:hypothetical protein
MQHATTLGLSGCSRKPLLFPEVAAPIALTTEAVLFNTPNPPPTCIPCQPDQPHHADLPKPPWA